ncbi:Protein TIFY 4B-like isoform X1 [Sarracenia purpurea var. burkii]
MSAEETVLRSPLDKPLHQLTEEDISQLTREDCRRYLKEKGMRRPSWNKSQAIQQVISLKTLLETSPDSDAGARKKLYIHRPENHHRLPKSTSADAPISVPDEDSVPYRRKDPEKHHLSGDRHLVDGNDSIPPRNENDHSFLLLRPVIVCMRVNQPYKQEKDASQGSIKARLTSFRVYIGIESINAI